MPYSGQRFYEEHEAEQILNLAATISHSLGKMSRQGLLDTAAELGISPDAVEAAEKQIAAQRLDDQLRSEFHANRRAQFTSYLLPYVIFNFAFVILCIGHQFWAFWPILAWAIGLAAQARALLFRGSSAYQRRYVVWKAIRMADDFAADHASQCVCTRPKIVAGVHVGSKAHRRLSRKLARRSEEQDLL